MRPASCSEFGRRLLKAFPGVKFQRWSAELTTVLPIGSGIGILAEGIFPGSAAPGLRAGLILASEIGKQLATGARPRKGASRVQGGV